MPYCAKCGTQLNDGSNFCHICGAMVESARPDNDSFNAPPNSPPRREEEYAGKLIKCPGCGTMLNSFIAQCPNCGYELRDAKVSASVRELYDNIRNETNAYDVIRLIEAFPVPNSREDIIEFMVLASSNFNVEDYMQHMGGISISNAWLSKIEQCYMKAELTLSGDDLIMINDIYHDVQRRATEAKRRVELARQSQQTDKKVGEFKKSKLRIVLIIFSIFSVLLCYVAFQDGKILSGIVALIMTGLFLVAFLMGNGVIKEFAKNFHLVPAIIAFLLIVPYFTLSDKESSVAPTIIDNYLGGVEQITWDDFIMGEHIPEFGDDEAEVVNDSEDYLTLYFYDMEQSDYNSYIEECRNFGYTIDAEQSDANYTAYNSEGYYLHLQYLDFSEDKSLTINLEDPKEHNQITWPESSLVKDLPVPKSLIGEVSTENSEAYCVYIVQIEPEYFSEYVSLCMENGFDEDYSKSDTYFSAENNKGISLTVEYEGFNTLSIYINSHGW